MAATNYLEGISLHRPQKALYRNIVSLRTSEDLFDDLGGSAEAQDAANRLEVQTKPHPYGVRDRIIQRPFDEADWFNAIQFPFENWQASRFSDGRFGVWYGAGDLDTTIYETAYHWAQFLADAGWTADPSIEVERAVFTVECTRSLLDFRSATELLTDLRDPNSYAFTQSVGRQAQGEGQSGLISISARCDGDTYAVFDPAALINPKSYCYLTYSLEDSGVAVQRTPGRKYLTIPF